MATCLITEFSDIQSGGQQRQLPAAIGEVTTQSVSYTTSAASAAFSAGTLWVRVISDAAVYLKFGAAPTATATAIRLVADTPEYFGVTEGQKVACYDGSS